MQKILKASVVYRCMAAIYAWFGQQWKDSRIISRFLRPKWGENGKTTGILVKLVHVLRHLLCIIFERLHFNKLFDNSIFKQSWLWCTLPIVLAPIVPTMVLLALALIGFLSVTIEFGCDREKHIMPSHVNGYTLLYAGVYLVAIAMSVTISGSLFGGILTVFFIVCSVVFQGMMKSRKQLDHLLISMVVAGVLVSLYGIYQYIFHKTGSAAWVDADMFSDITTRVYSTLENPNVLAEYLLLIIPFSVACFFTSHSKGKKFCFFVSTCIMVLCMVLTFSRGGWLGLLFAAAVFIVIWDRRFIVIGLLALIALYFILPETIIGRFTSIGNMGDSSTSYRVYIWMGTLAMLKDYWICGVGPGMIAYSKIYPAYSYNGITAPHAHNLFLQIMCDCGAAGLFVFVIILFQYFRTTCSAIASVKDKDTNMYLIAAVSSVAGFIVQSMTDHSFYNYRVMFLFWIVIAIGILCARRMELPEKVKLWSK